MPNQLEQLRKITKIVIDTGDINSIKTYAPTDATTNPSLIFAAAKNPEYRNLIQEAVAYSAKHAKEPAGRTQLLMDKLFVNFGVEILKFIPGRVSTEVDARLSFDRQGSVEKAHTLIKLYEASGIPRERVLIKLASTWEGIMAARQLEQEGIRCNMTLLFSLPQAIGCAEAKATLVSPFVGRILDWYKKNQPEGNYLLAKDPGVISVTEIYGYFKKFDYATQVMGASFRNIGEITELAGCDLLTISPTLLEELSKSAEPIERKLDPQKAKGLDLKKVDLDEKTFRYMFNQNAMASEKLREGICKFAEDAMHLEQMILKEFKS